MQLVAPSLTEVAVRPPPLNLNCQQIATKERKSTLPLTNCIDLHLFGLSKLKEIKTHFKIEVRSLCKGVSKFLTAYRI